ASLTKAGLLTDRSSQTGGLPISEETVAKTCRSARCSQWRDRAGFTPASLFTRPRKDENLGIVYGYHIGVPRVNEILTALKKYACKVRWIWPKRIPRRRAEALAGE